MKDKDIRDCLLMLAAAAEKKSFKDLYDRDVGGLSNTIARLIDELAKAKADTVREMQERLEKRIKGNLAYYGWYLNETVIPEITKEMLEEAK